MDVKIIEKPWFFLGFFNIVRKSLEAYPRQGQTRKGLPKAGPSQKKKSEKPAQGSARPGKAIGQPDKPLETPWGGLRGVLGRSPRNLTGKGTSVSPTSSTSQNDLNG